MQATYFGTVFAGEINRYELESEILVSANSSA
jgi:hypothetical protein